jgi:hypothetical protein
VRGNVAVTMYAGDREIIRIVSTLLGLAASHLDGINDSGLLPADRQDINQAITDIKSVQDVLNRLDSRAVTYQLSPGKTRP